jgi:hypothetical protein
LFESAEYNIGPSLFYLSDTGTILQQMFDWFKINNHFRIKEDWRSLHQRTKPFLWPYSLTKTRDRIGNKQESAERYSMAATFLQNINLYNLTSMKQAYKLIFMLFSTQFCVQLSQV